MSYQLSEGTVCALIVKPSLYNWRRLHIALPAHKHTNRLTTPSFPFMHCNYKSNDHHSNSKNHKFSYK